MDTLGILDRCRVIEMKKDGYPSSAYFYVGAPSYYSDWLPMPVIPDIPQPDMKSMAKELWKMMFDFPVLVPCEYCNSVNAVTNGTCFHCNGPLGDAMEKQMQASMQAFNLRT